MMNGRENAKLAPPIITKNSRTLFLVWNGMFWKKDGMEKEVSQAITRCTAKWRSK